MRVLLQVDGLPVEFVFRGELGSLELVKKIYVGNLPFSATEDEVRDLFASHGTVHEVSLLTDRETGRPRGFGFVQMDDQAAEAAISALDGQDFGGRNLRVNEAQDRRGGGGGGGGGHRGRNRY